MGGFLPQERHNNNFSNDSQYVNTLTVNDVPRSDVRRLEFNVPCSDVQCSDVKHLGPSVPSSDVQDVTCSVLSDDVSGTDSTVNVVSSVRQQKLKVLFSNVDTLSNKCSELEVYLSLESPHIIGLCEIFPKNSDDKESVADLVLPNYDKFVPDIQGGRGVIIFTHQSIRASKVCITPHSEFSETVWCEIVLDRDDKLLIGLIYRSPSSTDSNNQDLCSLINSSVSLKYSHMLVMGDFNYRSIVWNSLDATVGENHPAAQFLQCTLDNFLYQHVTEPTRFRDGQDPSCLDLIFTNEENMVNRDSLTIGSPLGNSDHAVLQFDFMCYLNNEEVNGERYQYFKGDYMGLTQSLQDEDWVDLLEDKTVEEMWNTFKTKLINGISKYIPKRRLNRKFIQPPLWMDRSAREAIVNKRKKWKRYKYSRSRVAYTDYATSRNTCTNTIRNSKISYEKKIAMESKMNSKSFWKYVNSKLKTRSGVSNLKNVDSTITSNDQEKVNVLNDFFSSVFTRTDNLNEQPYVQEMNTRLEDIEIRPVDVLKKLKELKTDKSPGHDGLHPKVLHETREAICQPLCDIFNKSISEGEVPSDWRKAVVTPIFKKGDKQLPGNYRPVSLTSILCKVCESLIRDKLMEHLNDNNLLSEDQYGFRPGRSCTTQLLEVLEHWSALMDSSFPIDVIYLDFSKAFDTVPHERLLHKLYTLGIHGNVLTWIQSFLSGRTQCVRYRDVYSSWSSVLSGVPQGSVLGPVLFLCFINDLPETVSGLVKIFADDSKLFSNVLDEESRSKLQEDLDKLCDWSSKWKLCFNASKCKVLHMGYKNENQRYTMIDKDENYVALTSVQDEKDLGVTFESSLKFEKHITNCVNKAQRTVGLIKRTFDYMDSDMFLVLYKSIVRPILEYSTCVWSPYLKKDIRRVEAIQRRATKLVQNIRHFDYEDRMKSLGLPTLEYRRKRNDLIQVYKAFHGLDDIKWQDMFIRSTNDTRGHSLKLFKRQCRTTQRLNTFAFRVIDSWNNLSEETVNATSLNMFKSRLNQENWNDNKFITL